MKLGYVHADGFPVFSNWEFRDGKAYLRDDRYFHVFRNKLELQTEPSAYMQEKEKADALFNFIAFPASEAENVKTMFGHLPSHLAHPRLLAGESAVRK